MKSTFRTHLAIAGMATLLVAAGCNSSDGTAANPPVSDPPTTPSSPAGQPVTTFAIASFEHVETPVSYPQTPPVGGDHHPGWQNCGVYDEPVPNENAVHSLEHGAVWVTYDATLAASEVAQLAKLAAGQTHVLVSPFPEIPAPIVLSAWGVQQRFDRADDPGIAAFIQTYQLGVQAPEPGAPCSRGVGEPS